jgi:hypothetical protein
MTPNEHVPNLRGKLQSAPFPNEISMLQGRAVLTRNTTIDSIIEVNEFGANIAKSLRALKDGESVVLLSPAAGTITVRCGSGKREIKRFRLRY